MIIFIYTS